MTLIKYHCVNCDRNIYIDKSQLPAAPEMGTCPICNSRSLWIDDEIELAPLGQSSSGTPITLNEKNIQKVIGNMANNPPKSDLTLPTPQTLVRLGRIFNKNLYVEDVTPEEAKEMEEWLTDIFDPTPEGDLTNDKKEKTT